MLTAEDIKQHAKKLSIPKAGVCRAERDGLFALRVKERREKFSAACFEETDIEKCVNPLLLMPEAKSVIVCLFPYYISDLKTENISRYAALCDYHRVAGELLSSLADFIKSREPEAKCLAICDTSPLMDRMLAYRAGLGFFGKNNLLIHPKHGSYFFIGSILTNLSVQADEPLAESCGGCGACLAACPGGALSEDCGFDCSKCVSYLTQIKTLTSEQEEILKGQTSVYGCDVCQEVCPFNQNLPDTPIQAFYKEPLAALSKAELETLTNRGFKKKFAAYPFSWCTRSTILKNFH